MKLYLKLEVRKGKTAVAYITRFREVVIEVRTVGVTDSIISVIYRYGPSSM